MAWKTITADDVLSEFTPQEQTALKGIQGASEQLPGIVGRVISAARGAIRAGGYALGDEGTVPDQFELDVVAIARWRWLIAFPQLQRLQTRERQAAHDQALARLDRAALQRLGVEPIEPGGRPPSGSWDSAVRIKGRMQTRDSGRRGGLGFELDGGGRVGRPEGGCGREGNEWPPTSPRHDT